MKKRLIILLTLFNSVIVFSQEEKLKDTTYFFFKEDGSYQIKGDGKTFLPNEKDKDSLFLFQYSLKGTGTFYSGEFLFINKNSDGTISLPQQVKKSFVKEHKNQTVDIDYLQQNGHKDSYFSAIYNKKALYLVYKNNGKYYTLRVTPYFTYIFDE